MELAELLRNPGGPLPSHAVADTIHWAVAAGCGCDYVSTWNYRSSAPQKNWKEGWEALTHDEIVEEIHAYRADQYERFGGDA